MSKLLCNALKISGGVNAPPWLRAWWSCFCSMNFSSRSLAAKIMSTDPRLWQNPYWFLARRSLLEMDQESVQNNTGHNFASARQQVRNQLGTPKGRRIFRGGPKFTSIAMYVNHKLCPTYFYRGGENFSRWCESRLLPPKLRACTSI